jgi:hypothetical protein
LNKANADHDEETRFRLQIKANGQKATQKGGAPKGRRKVPD